MWVLHGAEDYACTRWEGTVWDVESDTIPLPIVDTHPNCKCELIPVTFPLE